MQRARVTAAAAVMLIAGTASADDTAVVHIDSPAPVELYRATPGGRWTMVCASPCDIPVPLDGVYRIDGRRARSSASFRLPRRAGVIDIDVSPTSIGGVIAGTVTAGVGFLTMIGGLFVALVEASMAAVFAPDSDKPRTALYVAAGGAVVMGIGLVATVLSFPTDVDVHDDHPNDAWRRLATWRSASELLPAAQFPVLFSHAF